jgi:PAS domain S-box-containing protein
MMAAMVKKQQYIPPHFNRYDFEASSPDSTERTVNGLRQELQNRLSAGWDVTSECTTVIDIARRYVQVSDSFCKLVGYTREELLGMRYDDLTAPNTNDIPTVIVQFLKLRYLHGLWMFVSRDGTRILVRYEWWLRPDSLIEGHMEVVGTGNK